jgi:hypothetical protein
MLRARVLASLLAVGFVVGVGASACTLPNPNHCYNLAADPHVWCTAHYGEERPYCSPCTAEHNGCVSEPPSEDECPGFSRPAETESGAETETGSETETETGSETETETETE